MSIFQRFLSHRRLPSGDNSSPSTTLYRPNSSRPDRQHHRTVFRHVVRFRSALSCARFSLQPKVSQASADHRRGMASFFRNRSNSGVPVNTFFDSHQRATVTGYARHTQPAPYPAFYQTFGIGEIVPFERDTRFSQFAHNEVVESCSSYLAIKPPNAPSPSPTYHCGIRAPTGPGFRCIRFRHTIQIPSLFCIFTLRELTFQNLAVWC